MRAFYQADPRGAVPPPLPSVEPSPQLAKLIAIALRDLEGGLEPIGVAGKRPTAEGWQEGEITEERIRADFSDEHTGIGWRTGNLSAADVDIQDPELNGAVREIVHQMLSPTPYERIGADPKILLVYRNETPIKKITVSGVMKGGTLAKLEILGVGQQFVSIGTHPDTEKPYRWVGSGGRLKRLSDLPTVTPDDLLALAQTVADLFRRWGSPR
jgi:putative DNA primase/helicase